MKEVALTKWKIGSVVVGLLLVAMARPALAFEVTARDRSCAGESSIQYLENEISGEIAAKAFQGCAGQAVRQVSPIQFDTQKTDDGNCEAFDELVTGTGQFECVSITESAKAEPSR